MTVGEQERKEFLNQWGELMNTAGPWGEDETRQFLRAVFQVKGLGARPDTLAIDGVEKKLDLYRRAIPDLIKVVRAIGLGEGEDLIWKNPIKAATVKRKIAFLNYQPTKDWAKFCLLPIYFDEKGLDSFWARLGVRVDSSDQKQSYRELCKAVLRRKPPEPHQGYWDYVDMILGAS